jgi:hypothetical protein
MYRVDGMMAGEKRIGKVLNGSDRCLIEFLHRHLSVGTENHEARITRLPAKSEKATS